MNKTTITREEWLNLMVAELRPEFEKKSATIPAKVRVSCGFPSKSALSDKKKRVGECWSDKSSEDWSWEIFISPLLMGSVEVSAVLLHELVHTAVGIECKHRGPFKRIATAMGLEGKMTATTPSAELVTLLGEITDRVGKYPHARLTASNRPKAQTCRQLKVVCQECECICRMSRKAIDEVGCPTCACGGEMRESDGEGEGD